MLRTLSSEALVSRCLRALGYTSSVPSGTDFAQRVADYVNDALRRVWTHAHWPMVRRVERRAYRPPYTFELVFREGQECWHKGAYWRAEVEGPEHAPGEGNPEWRRLNPDEVARFIALDQPWENTEIALGGVDLTGFAYARDPKAFPDQPPIVGCAFAGDYPGGGTTRVVLPQDAPDEVWIAFIPEEPRISLEPWKSEGDYAYGDTVHHKGESWMCVGDRADVEPGATPCEVPWRRVRIPEFMAPCVVAFVQAAFASEDQGRAQSEAMAQNLLDRLYETYFGVQGVDDRADCDRE